jgi:hypothetical protein
MILILASLFGAGFSLAVITSPIVIPWVMRRMPDRRQAPAKRRVF